MKRSIQRAQTWSGSRVAALGLMIEARESGTDASVNSSSAKRSQTGQKFRRTLVAGSAVVINSSGIDQMSGSGLGQFSQISGRGSNASGHDKSRRDAMFIDTSS